MPATQVEDLPELTLQAELRIGSLDDPALGFTSIGDVWISPTGEVYVSETRELEIRVFGTDSRLLRTYGRRGDGRCGGQQHLFAGIGRGRGSGCRELWHADAERGRQLQL